jgi:hypothetical protein
MKVLKTNRPKAVGFDISPRRQRDTDRRRLDELNIKKGFRKTDEDDREAGDEAGDEEGFQNRTKDEAPDTPVDAPAETPVDSVDDDRLIQITVKRLQQLKDNVQKSSEAAYGQEVDRLKRDLDAVKKEKEIEAEKARQEIDRLKKDESAIDSIFGGFGTELGLQDRSDLLKSPSPYIIANPRVLAQDAMKELVSLFDNAPKFHYTDKNKATFYTHHDTEEFDAFVRKNPDAARDGMELYARQHGLLAGGGRSADAPTAKTDVPPAFLTYLSGQVRRTHHPNFIWSQFANFVYEANKGIGDTIQVPRQVDPPLGTSESDWDLTGVTSISGSDNPARLTAANCIVKEYGLGKGTNNQFPITVPHFISARSLLDLESLVVKNLGFNYSQFEEMCVRSRYLATTQVRYNKKGLPAPLVGSLVAGDDCTLTYSFLNNLFAEMSTQQIPMFPNGKYAIVVPPATLAQLLNSLAAGNNYISQTNREELTNMLNSITNNDFLKISGYAFDCANFMIFSSNNTSVGVPGTQGVNNSTIAAIVRTFRSCYAFGVGAVGRGVGMPMQIARDLNDDFGRRERLIWTSHEAFTSLDVDSALGGDQQTRVLEVRLCTEVV